MAHVRFALAIPSEYPPSASERLPTHSLQSAKRTGRQQAAWVNHVSSCHVRFKEHFIVQACAFLFGYAEALAALVVVNALPTIERIASDATSPQPASNALKCKGLSVMCKRTGSPKPRCCSSHHPLQKGGRRGVLQRRSTTPLMAPFWCSLVCGGCRQLNEVASVSV